MSELPASMRQLRSLVHSNGTLELSIATVPMPVPADHEVVVLVEAAPINPSDLGLLLAMADTGKASVGGTAEHPVVTMPIAANVMRGLQARVGESMPVGNEGCGIVVAAGASADAQALMGKRVAMAGGATYAEYRAVPAIMCMELPADITAAQGASCFVNPLTALGMVETMRLEGHTGLVHTAAASNLGQMLNRICLQDDVPLVNVVRRPEQAALLRQQGAIHVCDSSAPSFADDLVAALVATRATLAFDAIGGGKQVGQILTAMETAINASATSYNRYGSDTHKQVYIYGGLDRGPTEFGRTFGMAWGIGGWLLTPFLGRIGLEGMLRLRHRVVSELTTTFASHYTDEVSLSGAIEPTAIAGYAKQATGEKYLIRPQLG